MKKITITPKDKKAGAKKLDLANDTFFAKMEKAGQLGSTGFKASYLEPLVRHIWKKSGIVPDDFRVHSAGEHDALSRANGGLEVKVANGIIGYTRTETIRPEYCKLDRYVAYCAKPDEIETLDDVLDCFYIFTREEFLEFVATAGLKRKAGNFASGCKLGVNSQQLRVQNKTLPRGQKLHDCICLQPSYLEARYNACLAGYYPTLRTFIEG